MLAQHQRPREANCDKFELFRLNLMLLCVFLCPFDLNFIRFSSSLGVPLFYLFQLPCFSFLAFLCFTCLQLSLCAKLCIGKIGGGFFNLCGPNGGRGGKQHDLNLPICLPNDLKAFFWFATFGSNLSNRNWISFFRHLVALFWLAVLRLN